MPIKRACWSRKWASWSLNYRQDNLPDVNTSLLFVWRKSCIPLTCMSRESMNSKHSRHFHMWAWADVVQISPKRHIFYHTGLYVGALGPWTHVWANIQTIVAAVLGDNCSCLSPAVFLLTLNTQRQNVHFSVSRVVVACSPLHQKAKQKCVLVVMDRICHSAAGWLMLLSCHFADEQLKPKHKGHLSTLKKELSNRAVQSLWWRVRQFLFSPILLTMMST